MDELALENVAFTVGWCAICSREVLTCADYDANGIELRRCVHCDQQVGHALRAVPGDELGRRGYVVAEPGGCGRPDCGNGRCGR